MERSDNQIMKSLFFLLALAAYGQPLAYSLLPNGGDAAPTARVDGTIAYDPTGKQIFLFGGQDGQDVKNDLWSYTLSAKSWRKLNP